MRVSFKRVIAFFGGILLGGAVLAQTNTSNAQNATAQALVDAVVQVETTALPDARSNETLGRDRSGSGVLIDARGYVLTIGYLVIEAESISVTDSNDRTVPAALAAYDHATGFALLKLLAPLDTKPLALGDSSAVNAHDVLMILPFGGREAAQLARVVSKRPFTGSWEYLLEEAIFVAPPTQQWAGAALIGRDLKLVGVGSLRVGDAAGNGESNPGNMFVPIDILKPILPDMIAAGKRKGAGRPWLGMGTEQMHGMLIVTRVSPESPAAAAGIETGDVVIGVSNVAVNSQSELYRKVWGLGDAGVKVPLRLRRGTAVRDVVVDSIERTTYFRESVRQ
ncbi:MAG TPA: S1C family serine protease [Burkholderiaceae bacterium]|nr:S1C family serine protease [Burkholderiaceae bacterium]